MKKVGEEGAQNRRQTYACEYMVGHETAARSVPSSCGMGNATVN